MHLLMNKFTKRCRCLGALTCLLFSVNAVAQIETIPTTDGQATLNILVEYPSSGNQTKTPVIILAGGVFADRDGITDAGDIAGYPESYLLFRQLSQLLLTMGFIVVRYDQRGINGNIFSCEKGTKLTYEKYIKQCIDSKIRSVVTPQSIQADIESVFKFASQLKAANTKKIYALGHSEASLHFATLIGEKRITLAGVIFIAGILEAPAKAAEWQAIDRFVEALPSLDENNDGLVTNIEISRAFLDNRSAMSQQTQNGEALFRSPTGSWKLSDPIVFRNWISKLLYVPYVASMDIPDANKTGFTSVVSGVDVTWASRGWMLGIIKDTKPTVDRLDSYRGKGLFIFLSLDSQLSVPRQIAAIEKSKFGLAHNAKIVTINGFGHLLGKLPGKGPVDPQAMNEVSAAIRAWLPASMQSR